MTRLCNTLAAGVAAAALLAGAANAADLRLKRVLLSTGGVGLYEYEADVEGDASVVFACPILFPPQASPLAFLAASESPILT